MSKSNFLCVVFELEVGMSSHSGIRARSSSSSEFAKKIVLKDAASYGPWKAKIVRTTPNRH